MQKIFDNQRPKEGNACDEMTEPSSATKLVETSTTAEARTVPQQRTPLQC